MNKVTNFITVIANFFNLLEALIFYWFRIQPINSVFLVLKYQDTYGFMVAFAGRKYAARSLPTFVANGTYTVTSFTLVSIDKPKSDELEFFPCHCDFRRNAVYSEPSFIYAGA